MNDMSRLYFTEWSLLFVVLVSAGGMTLVLRRIVARSAAQGGAKLRSCLVVMDSLLFPLLTLGLGHLAFHALNWLCAHWGQVCSPSLKLGWNLFWLAMLGFNLVEATVTLMLNNGAQGRIPALLRGVLRIVVIALSAFFVLRFVMGFDITPLLASTALLTAVVGFALQGVLGNLMAGMSLNMTGSLAQEDWIAVDGVEGRVEEMNWRETWLVTREQIAVRIPNSKVAEANIRHLSRPAHPRRCSILAEASYTDPPDLVVDAMLAAALAVADVCRTPQPIAFPQEYKNYGICYEMYVWLDAYPFRAPILGEVRRRIWYEFNRRGIKMPYPLTDQVLNVLAERVALPSLAHGQSSEAGHRVIGFLQSDFANKVLRGADGVLLVQETRLVAWAERLLSQRYGRNEILFCQGEVGDCCYVVLSGQLEGRIRYPDSAKETRFEVGVGAVLGEMSLMTGLPRIAEIKVLQSAELLKIPEGEFTELLRENPELLGPLSELVAERMQSNRQQYEIALAMTPQPFEQLVSGEGILKRFWRLLGVSEDSAS